MESSSIETWANHDFMWLVYHDRQDSDLMVVQITTEGDLLPAIIMFACPEGHRKTSSTSCAWKEQECQGSLQQSSSSMIAADLHWKIALHSTRRSFSSVLFFLWRKTH
jgi:hypothetical protein